MAKRSKKNKGTISEGKMIKAGRNWELPRCPRPSIPPQGQGEKYGKKAKKN